MKKVYMFIDALGWEIVKEYNFLEKELPYRKPIQMQFGYSCTAVPTILSGKSPAEHGHFAFYYCDKENSPFKFLKYVKYFFGAGLHPQCLCNRGRVRHFLSKIVKKHLGYTGYFQLYNVPFEKLRYFNYCEKKDIFAPNGLEHVKNLADVWSEKKLRYHISDWRKSEEENVKIAKQLIEEDSADYFFIYTAALDSFLHDNVLDKEKIAARVKNYESMVKDLLRSLQKYDYTFTVISDHGMTPKSGTVDLMEKVKKLGFKFGKDYISFYDSTMLRLWFFNEAARKQICERLSLSDCCGRLLTKNEKIERGIFFEDSKFGEEIFLCDVGIQIEPCDLGRRALNGMHGFDFNDKDSLAAFLSTKAPQTEPKKVQDYFAIMECE